MKCVLAARSATRFTLLGGLEKAERGHAARAELAANRGRLRRGAEESGEDVGGPLVERRAAARGEIVARAGEDGAPRCDRRRERGGGSGAVRQPALRERR